MKKALLLTLFIILLIPSVLALNLTVNKLDSQNTIIKGSDHPARINLEITNKGNTDTFTFYNLLGFTIKSEEVEISQGETETVQLIIFPRDDLDVKNYYNFQYFIRASSGEEQEEKILLKIVKLGDAFEVGTENLDPDSNSLDVYIHNKENTDFENLDVKFSSNFFEFSEKFDLDANKRKDFTIELDKDQFKDLTAGFYTLDALIKYREQKTETEGIIKFTEKDIVETTEEDFGWIVSTKIIKKINQGNTIQTSDVVVKKNIISRLFTGFEPEPDVVKREGTTVYYTWNKEIRPGKSLDVTVKTNWLYPLLIMAFIAVIVVLVKQAITTDVQIRKRVKFVKAKGGQFALKVFLHVHSKKYVERINIVDKLPSLMKIYKKFGGEKPSRINKKARLIEWDFEKFEAGEVRTLSYVIYSKKIGVMGKFALPSATAIYQKNGKVKETTSNKAFFVTEQKD